MVVCATLHLSRPAPYQPPRMHMHNRAAVLATSAGAMVAGGRTGSDHHGDGVSDDQSSIDVCLAPYAASSGERGSGGDSSTASTAPLPVEPFRAHPVHPELPPIVARAQVVDDVPGGGGSGERSRVMGRDGGAAGGVIVEDVPVALKLINRQALLSDSETEDDVRRMSLVGAKGKA